VNAGQLNDVHQHERTANGGWKKIDWKRAEETVNRIQIRIVKAVESGKNGLVKRLQYLLAHSFFAKALAIKRVTSSHGKSTPGVDGVVWKTPEEKFEAISRLNNVGYQPKALRRVYIEKPGKKEKRPLSIPAMIDRAQQALHLLTLAPIAETQADKTSFGFRECRSTADAMQYAHLMLSRKTAPQWVVEGDIKGCFDNINHQWLTDNIPMDTEILTKFLKADYSYRNRLYPTTQGSAQGGVISPTLANMTLDGLQQELGLRLKGRKHHFIRYADDFIVIVKEEETARETIGIINSFLEIRGLRLSETKTKITHITEGFDFLGWNFRKYRNGHLIIKPSVKSIKRFVESLKLLFHKMRTATQDELIKALDPRITGWSNYHACVNAKQTFNKMDNYISRKAWIWGKRRHGTKKNNDWVKERYWKSRGNRSHEFATDKQWLKRCSDTPIVRHSLVKLDQNPYTDGAYFADKAKWRKQQRRMAYNKTTVAQLIKRGVTNA
jgi:RNA-directed DNA polymerase